MLGKLQGAVNKEGRTIAALFMELPKRSEWPEYYKVIKQPIDARIIEHRLDHFEYPGVLDFAEDVQLMLDNAARFNVTSEVNDLNGNVLSMTTTTFAKSLILNFPKGRYQCHTEYWRTNMFSSPL